MKAYPPDDERFVERRTSVKDWPVFSDQGGPISPSVVVLPCLRIATALLWGR